MYHGVCMFYFGVFIFRGRTAKDSLWASARYIFKCFFFPAKYGSDLDVLRYFVYYLNFLFDGVVCVYFMALKRVTSNKHNIFFIIQNALSLYKILHLYVKNLVIFPTIYILDSIFLLLIIINIRINPLLNIRKS